MKEHRHLGAYGLVIRDDEILLIKKVGGPYDGMLDLPGGSMGFSEKPEDALKRELLEEVGIEVIDYKLFDADSVVVYWKRDDGSWVRVHHIGVFYKILDYNNEIKKEVEIDEVNDDSLGAEFFSIKDLSKDELSAIAVMELEKLGYYLN